MFYILGGKKCLFLLDYKLNEACKHDFSLMFLKCLVWFLANSWYLVKICQVNE